MALGMLWGGRVAVLGMISRTGWGEGLRELLDDLYIGYDDTNTGILLGAMWWFADALVGGVLAGLLNNAFDRIA